MRLLFYLLFCVCALSLGLTACGGGSSGNVVLPSLIPPTPSPSPSPAQPTPPPAPTPTPIGLALGDIVGTPTYPFGDTAQGGQGALVDGIPCDNAPIVFHIHTHVSLFHNGTQVAIPLAIGIMNPQFFNSGTVADNGTCFYHLHTHDSSGIVHIENPVVPPTPFTLGQFFDIWGEPLTTSNIAGFSGPTLVYIATCTASVPFTCGAPSVYSGDPRAVTLAQHEQITLEVGGPYVWPPFYSWSY